MSVNVIDTGTASAQANMDLDARLLEELSPADAPIVHLYRWEGKAATHGIFADPTKLLCQEAVQRYNLHLGKRPTGGGITFHQWDLAFSVLVPSGHAAFSTNTLENYRFINTAVATTVAKYRSLNPQLLVAEPQGLSTASAQFCMAKPTKYDVMDGGFKIGGAAQRRKKNGYLHQGTIFLVPPDMTQIQDLLSVHPEVCEAIRANSQYLSSEVDSLENLRNEVECLLVQHLRNAFT